MPQTAEPPTLKRANSVARGFRSVATTWRLWGDGYRTRQYPAAGAQVTLPPKAAGW